MIFSHGRCDSPKNSLASALALGDLAKSFAKLDVWDARLLDVTFGEVFERYIQWEFQDPKIQVPTMYKAYF